MAKRKTPPPPDPAPTFIATTVVPSAPPPPGFWRSVREYGERASGLQKIGAFVIVAVAVAGLLATGVTRYAPWAWAGDVRRVEQKVDTLTLAVLQSARVDTENKIAGLEGKRAKAGLTPVEDEYLRVQYRRLGDLTKDIDAVRAGSRPR